MQNCAKCKHPVKVSPDGKVYNCDKYRRDDGTFIMSSPSFTDIMVAESIPYFCLDDGHFEAKEANNG